MRSSDSGRRQRRVGAPYLVPAALALVAALAFFAGRGRLSSCGASVASPETQIRRALANQTRAHLEDVYGFKSGGTLELTRIKYGDIVVSVDADRATVVALLDAEGHAVWRDEAADVSYLGREQFHMRPCRIALWCAEGDQFARLRGVLALLFRRADAFNERDPSIYARIVSPGYRDRDIDRDALLKRLSADFEGGPAARVRVKAWQVRVERETAEAGEDYEIEISGREPVRLRALYRLERQGERWQIVGGL